MSTFLFRELRPGPSIMTADPPEPALGFPVLPFFSNIMLMLSELRPNFSEGCNA